MEIVDIESILHGYIALGISHAFKTAGKKHFGKQISRMRTSDETAITGQSAD